MSTVDSPPASSRLGRRSLGMALCLAIAGADASALVTEETLRLPRPVLGGSMSVEKALSMRRSTREFAREQLALATVSQLLWAAQGVTDERGYRTAPSAGALFPLEIRLVAGNVSGLASGVYAYDPVEHRLRQTVAGDIRSELAKAAYQQEWIADAAAIVIVAADFARTARKYGARAKRYVHMEAGHASQNVYLQSTALDLAVCVVGAFDDSSVKRLLGFEDEIDPLALMPVGKPPRRAVPE